MAAKSDDALSESSDESDGQLFLWHGFHEVHPRHFEFFRGIPVHQVALGARHCAFLTNQGQVFTYGNNQFGQLGVGTFEKALKEPKLVDGLPDDICAVACGARHTAAVSLDGVVYCWGDSTDGQCGSGEVGKYATPQRITVSDSLSPRCPHTADSYVKVEQVSCGHYHTTAVSEHGEIWVWGSGMALGLNTYERALSPVKLSYLIGRHVLSVACGAEHTVALVEKLTRRSVVMDSEKKASPACVKCNPQRSVDHCDVDVMCPLGLELPTQKSNTTPKIKKADSFKLKDPPKGRKANVENGHTDTAEVKPKERSKDSDSSNSTETSLEDGVDSPCSPNCALTLSKSRSAFLNEIQAKEFLRKQLQEKDESSSDDERPVTPSDRKSEDTAPSSPFVQKVENILQLMPAQPAAAMQEYLSNVTKTVVSNIKTSIDKFSLANVPEEVLESSLCLDLDHDMLLEQLGTFERYGSLPKSTSLGHSAYAAHRGHARKSSLPSGTLETLTENRILRTNQSRRPITLETEVWSWGKGSSGQLGHGDLLDRPQPCVVKALNDRHVVTVTAGSAHCLALTANCQVFAWGLNQHNQICSGEGIVSSPVKITIKGGAPSWDVAAGDTHSIILNDCNGLKSDVFFSGKQPGIEVSNALHRTTQFTRIGSLRDKGWLKSVASGGDICACIVNMCDSSLSSLMHEFAISERQFCSQMDAIESLFLRPLNALDECQAWKSSALGLAFETLFDAFFRLTQSVAVSHLELTQVIKGQISWQKLTFVQKSDQLVAIYQHYFKCFNDVLSIGGFEQCVNQFKPFFDKVQSQFVLVIDEKRLDRATIGSTFRRTLQTPLRRLHDYSQIAANIALKFSAYTNEHGRMMKMKQAWEALRQATSDDQTMADRNKTFWLKCQNPKLAEALKSPCRRLLKDSKSCPLQLHLAGRFSSHLFLLFSDVFVHVSYSGHQVFPLATIWIETISDTDQIKNGISLTMPEDALTLTAVQAADKGEWMWAIKQAICDAVTERKNLPRSSSSSSSSTPRPPPQDRHACYTFKKPGPYKDAKYEGMWKNSKLHGQGKLTWPDGREFRGTFHEGMQDGWGTMTTPLPEGMEVYEGRWKMGKMHGNGCLRYANGDLYEGHFQEGKKWGHGVFRQGRINIASNPEATVYIGEWVNDRKQGFGVLEYLTRGEKFMGMWMDDNRHGNGIIVSLDGIYFEGNFIHGKISGNGLLMTEDATYYEGQFSGGTNLSGKGTLTMPNNDRIEGTFYGSFSDGVKVTGTFHKAQEPTNERKGFSHNVSTLPSTFGQMSVSADRKWQALFAHCYSLLGCDVSLTFPPPPVRPDKAWQRVAAVLAMAKKVQKERSSKSANGLQQRRMSQHSYISDDLETIPVSTPCDRLTTEHYHKMKGYIAKAIDSPAHPLGQLFEALVDVYRASYVGVGAHQRLLTHAVNEVKSYISRIYPIIRLLFPDLPHSTEPQLIFSETCKDNEEGQNDDEGDKTREIVTAAGLLLPLLLPKIYPPLFTLFALHNEREDEKYWRRIRHWNKQSDVSLMSYLGLDEKFWLIEECAIDDANGKVSAIKNRSYLEAIDTLQRMSTSFSPAEKLQLIQLTFDEVNTLVQRRERSNYLWSMDDLFPVFLYVVVRARIQHLGAEIHFIDELMEPHLEYGEFGIMFTTLKACYFQIQLEKVL